MTVDWKLYLDAKALMFGKLGAIGGVIGAMVAELFHTGPSRGVIEAIFSTGLWAGVLGAGIASAVMISQDRYLKKEVWRTTWWKGLVPGLISGAAGGGLAQAMYSGIGPTEILRIFCWGVFGGLLGAFLSKKIPNLDLKKASAGGFAGGAVGGLSFIIVSALLAEFLGRISGGAIIGFFIGLAIAVTEAITREAWLEVAWSENEIGTISLGSRPILIGSGKDSDIYVRDLVETAAKIWIENGQVKIEDSVRNQVQNLAPGYMLKFGGIKATVRSA